MSTSQTQVLLKELAEGHDGRPIPESKRIYFQERLRARFFDFLVSLFEIEKKNGLTEAKLARRIGKRPEVVNRWMAAPSNFTLDSVSDLLLGLGAREMNMSAAILLNRNRVNFSHVDAVTDLGDFRKPPPEELTTDDLAQRNYKQAS